MTKELFVCGGQTFKTEDEAKAYSENKQRLTGKYDYITRYDLDKYADCFGVTPENGEYKFLGFNN